MDGKEFDEIAQKLGTFVSRRRALGGLAAGLLGAAGLTAAAAEGKGKGKSAQDKGKGKSAQGKGKDKKGVSKKQCTTGCFNGVNGCQTGLTDQQCGQDGQTCFACGGNTACVPNGRGTGGVCVANANCPTGQCQAQAGCIPINSGGFCGARQGNTTTTCLAAGRPCTPGSTNECCPTAAGAPVACVGDPNCFREFQGCTPGAANQCCGGTICPLASNCGVADPTPGAGGTCIFDTDCCGSASGSFCGNTFPDTCTAAGLSDVGGFCFSDADCCGFEVGATCRNFTCENPANAFIGTCQPLGNNPITSECPAGTTPSGTCPPTSGTPNAGGLICRQFCVNGQACSTNVPDAGAQCVSTGGICNSTNCQDNTQGQTFRCCLNGTCVSGTTTGQCGKGGAACANCAASGAQNPRCENGVCVSGPFINCGPGSATNACATGCCSGDTCQPGTANNACGKGGAACTACGNNQVCTNQACVTSGPPPCGPGTTNLCANGCCDAAGVCQGGTSNTQCGKGGTACATCTGTQVCTNQACVTAGPACGPGSTTNPCTGGCCSGSQCITAQSDAQCGTGGGACVACTGKQRCKNGVCKKKKKHHKSKAEAGGATTTANSGDVQAAGALHHAKAAGGSHNAKAAGGSHNAKAAGGSHNAKTGPKAQK